MSQSGRVRRRGPSIVLGAALLAVLGWWFRRVVVPLRPHTADTPRAHPLPQGHPRPSPDGAGTRIVINPRSGPAWVGPPTDVLRAGLPAADIRELEEGEDLAELLSDPAFTTVGASGGDGTLAAAAAVAAERGVPLVVVPGGTLNHLARDLGIDDVEDAVAAVRAGTAACIDVGTIGDRTFVNTLSFGGYTAVVDRREHLERWLGKWPALVVALVWELPRMRPLRLRIDGERVDVWVGWIGNGSYGPPGLGPAWREQLDDGVLDVRLVHGGPRYARTRFVLAAMMGRLSALSVYDERRVESLDIECLDGPQRLAADGETFDGPARFTVGKRRRALRVVLAPTAREPAG
ncbi:MAG: diacylglycerol kinase family protein [Acidimicrobiales bacterium]|nr:diacylglycerol kinase family protein [Acidimicrobiales bacterium]